MAVGEEKRLISREPTGRGGGREREMDEGGQGGNKGAELGEREQEKFTGEWVDATRPSNRRLDYSAQHIGRVHVREYVCERARARARARVYVFVFPHVSFFSARNIVYLYIPCSLSPPPSPHSSLSASRFFFFPFPVPEEHRSQSLTLAWIACVNAHPMVNELARNFHPRERLAFRAAAPRRSKSPVGDVLARMRGAITYLPAIYLSSGSEQLTSKS